MASVCRTALEDTFSFVCMKWGGLVLLAGTCGCAATLTLIQPCALVEHYLPLCTSASMSNTAVGEGFISKVDSTQTGLGSTFRMPRGHVSCGFKVPKRFTTLLCFGWIKKKNILSISAALPADMLLFLSCLVFGFEQRLVSSLRKSSRRLVLWWQQKNYLQNTLCQLAVQGAHKQDHLAIISSQPPIRTAERMFIKKKGATVREEENGTGGEGGQERGMEKRGGRGWVIGAREGSWCPGGEK